MPGASDWTTSETISPPETLVIAYRNSQGQEKVSRPTSTSSSKSTSTYRTFPYVDQDGKQNQQDVVAFQVDIKSTTQANANSAFASYRLSKGLGFPPGGDVEKTETTKEYRASTTGPVLIKETRLEYQTCVRFVGQLGLEDVHYEYYSPSVNLLLTQRTEIEYETVTQKDGREVTRTLTKSWKAYGLSQSGNHDIKRIITAVLTFAPESAGAAIEAYVSSMSDLRFLGTEVQTSTGRAPVPTKPSDAELTANEVTNGTTIPSDATPESFYGNNKGWPAFVPDGTDWKTLNQDSNGDGTPDWAQYVPDSFEDYNTDSNSDGTPDWADYVPGDWQDYVTDPLDWENTAIDSNGDGTPDWADNTPIGWEEFNSDTNYTNPEPEVNNEKLITGRVVFDGQNYSSGDPTVTATYDMPFAPDDYFYYKKGIRKLYRSGATAAATKFGQTEAALDIGHAFGQNIVSGFNETPTLDLSPLYIRLAGIEGAFLLDAASYAWGPEGMVVSSDLMLLGVTGYDGASAPAASWLRLPVAASSIGPASGTTIEASPVKANSIAIPGGFNIRNPASTLAALPTNGADVFKEWKSNTTLVPPSLELLTAVLTTRPVVAAVQYDYSISVDIETAILITRAFISERDDAFIPIPLITYSQSSVYSANDPATNATMTDDALIGSGTGTNDGVFEWIQLDIGGVYEVAKVVIGTATTQLPGGWDKSYTENRPIQYSIDGETWTTAGNTGTFAAEGIYELDLVFTARYIRITSAGDYLALMEFYPLAPEQPRTNYANLFTQPFIEYDDALIISGEVYQVIGTAAPILGATQVSPTSTATDDGWSLVFNGTQDEGSVGVTGFGFDFTLNNVAYTGCYVNANSYLTFGGTQNVYIGLGSSTPSLPKLLIGAADFSYQRIYTKSITGAFIIRWEGNIDYSAPAGSSNRFLEVTFYQVRSDGQQILEVRSGNHSGVAGVFMLATASTSLAQSTFAANESWVFIGNASGTDWTVASGRHAAIAES